MTDPSREDAIMELTDFLAHRTILATDNPGIARVIATRLYDNGWRRAPADAICGQRAWPYTENNICTLPPGHDPKDTHRDPLGRTFDAGGYPKPQAASS